MLRKVYNGLALIIFLSELHSEKVFFLSILELTNFYFLCRICLLRFCFYWYMFHFQNRFSVIWKLHDQYFKITYDKDFICLYIYICIGICVCHVVFSQISRNPRPVWKLLVPAFLQFAGKTLKEGIKWASGLVKPNLKWQKNERLIEKKWNPEVGNSIWDWDSGVHSWMPVGNIWRALKKYGYLGPFPEVRTMH